jgi:hypothetical protein
LCCAIVGWAPPCPRTGSAPVHSRQVYPRSGQAVDSRVIRVIISAGLPVAASLTGMEPAGNAAKDFSCMVVSVIGGASARGARVGPDVNAEALSITRLEGSRWRGGRLWSDKPEALVWE